MRRLLLAALVVLCGVGTSPAVAFAGRAADAPAAKKVAKDQRARATKAKRAKAKRAKAKRARRPRAAAKHRAPRTRTAVVASTTPAAPPAPRVAAPASADHEAPASALMQDVAPPAPRAPAPRAPSPTEAARASTDDLDPVPAAPPTDAEASTRPAPRARGAWMRDDGTHVGLRFGGGALALRASGDTPFLGSYFTQAADLYNAAAVAYNTANKLPAGAPAAAPAMDESAMDLDTALLTVTPALEAGGDGYFFRIEAPLGFGDDLRTYGLGIYPLNVGGGIGARGHVAAALSAGAVASYVTIPGADDAHGALVQGRVAGSLRLRSRGGWALTIELGWSPVALGGVVDFGRRQEVESYDPRGMTPPPQPGEIARGGEGVGGSVDLSVGVALP